MDTIMPRRTRGRGCFPSAEFARMPWPGSSPACPPADTISGLGLLTAHLSPPWATSPPDCMRSATRPGGRSPQSPTGRWCLICAHAGVKTGEDGPTHADPQALQLLQGNFPPGTLVTLTPWDPQEIWTLMSAALAKRPAVIAPFVTRPAEKVLDRKALGLAPATAAAIGRLSPPPVGKEESGDHCPPGQ